MADLFETTQLASMQDDKPVRLTIDGLSDEKLWLVKINGGARPNYQLMYAISGEKFLNTFQQRLRIWNIQGVYALADCDGPVDATGEPPFLKFYKEHNISAAAKLLRMAYSGTVIKGYLVELKLGDFQQEVVDGYQFNLQFLGIIQGLETVEGPATTTAASSVEIASQVTAPANYTSDGKGGYISSTIHRSPSPPAES